MLFRRRFAAWSGCFALAVIVALSLACGGGGPTAAPGGTRSASSSSAAGQAKAESGAAVATAPDTPEVPAKERVPRSQLKIKTRDIVRETLNFPKTAKFPWFSDFESEDTAEGYFVRETVEAQNAFGVPSDIEYAANWSKNAEGTWVLNLLVVDGKVLIGGGDGSAGEVAEVDEMTPEEAAADAREKERRAAVAEFQRQESERAEAEAARVREAERFERESRVFRSKAGTEMRAEIRGLSTVAGKKFVRLVGADGEDKQVDVALLSDEDQAFVAEWEKKRRSR